MMEYVTDECDMGHVFVKLPDHPYHNGKARCPNCMSIGIDVRQQRIDRLVEILEREGYTSDYSVSGMEDWIKVPALPKGGIMNDIKGTGLSLRDYFAAKALMGLMASRDPRSPYFVPEDDAQYVYDIADAMLCEREKTRNENSLTTNEKKTHG